MRFALLIWDHWGEWSFVDANEPWQTYLRSLRGAGVFVHYTSFAPSITSVWTSGTPHDSGHPPSVTPPMLDIIERYRPADLVGMLTIECSTAEEAQRWASEYPYIADVEVRRVDDAHAFESVSSPEALGLLARGWWTTRGDDTYASRVDHIVSDIPQLIPELIKALVESAPQGALPYIGVSILEDIAINADLRECDDTSLDMLLEAKLEPPVLFEILSGPYPNYLDRWRVNERLAGVLSPEQLRWLSDWHGRAAGAGRQAVADGDSVRYLDHETDWQRHLRGRAGDG